MTEAQMKQKIAQLESLNDQLMSEVDYVDKLMRLIGFQHGLASVKGAANEILRQGLVKR